ncbi:MAG: hypothetical protein C0490_23285 [Marivirga sp.]|nr:hypothetical protein [Marivirga sp.]
MNDELERESFARDFGDVKISPIKDLFYAHIRISIFINYPELQRGGQKAIKKRVAQIPFITRLSPDTQLNRKT